MKTLELHYPMIRFLTKKYRKYLNEILKMSDSWMRAVRITLGSGSRFCVEIKFVWPPIAREETASEMDVFNLSFWYQPKDSDISSLNAKFEQMSNRMSSILSSFCSTVASSSSRTDGLPTNTFACCCWWWSRQVTTGLFWARKAISTSYVNQTFL